MCDPISIAVAAVATTAVSTIYSASAQRATANAQAQQIQYTAQNEAAVADYNAQAVENVTDFNASVSEQNAAIYEEAAVDSIQRGADEAAFQRDFSKRGIATARAAAGSSGTVVDVGTNLDISTLNRQIGEMNALTVMNNAEREAYGYELEANAQRNEATGTRYTGEIEAENIRLNREVGLLNAQAGAANTRFAGKVNSRATLISGTAQTLRMGYNFFG